MKIPDAFQEHGACDDAVGVPEQEFEQPELPWLRLHCLAAAGRGAPQKVQSKIGHGQVNGLQIAAVDVPMHSSGPAVPQMGLPPFCGHPEAFARGVPDAKSPSAVFA